MPIWPGRPDARTSFADRGFRGVRQTPLALPAAALAFVAAAMPSGAETAFGTYQCVAERVVGLQGDVGSDGRYAGRIQLNPGEQRFSVTLDRTERGRGKRCRAERLSVADSPVQDEYSLWWFCRATTELSFSAGKYGEPLRGDDLHIFRDRLSGSFHLADDLRYVFAYTDFGGNFFLEEGICQAE
jgi:hypothetical protein